MKRILLAAMILLAGCGDIIIAEKIEVSGVVKEKATGYSTASRTMQYHTIILCDDGVVRDIQGIGAYSVPVGGRIRVKVWK